MRRAGLILAVWLLSVLPAVAERRVALVIGNGAYAHAPALANPGNDAGDIAGALERLGFETMRVSNGSFESMRLAMRELGRRASDAEMAVVFFAGHGMEIGGENWLLPVDAELRRDTDAENEAISLKSALLQVSGARRLGLVILDACRNNPFGARMARSTRTRAVDRGLVRIEPVDNVLVAYAAKEGTTADDGSARNSPFSAALLRHLETPGLEINFLFRSVRDDVMKATRNHQQPFVYGSLSREAVYLKPSGPVANAAPSAVDETRRLLEAERAKSQAEIARREAELKRLQTELRQAEEERRRLAAAAVVAAPPAAAPPSPKTPVAPARPAAPAPAAAAASPPPAAVPSRTEVRDEGAKRKVLGKHRMTLHWLDGAGSVQGTLSNGLIHLKGEHRSPAASGFAAGFVSIDGVVTKLDTLELWFQGTIKQVRHGETSCVREGLMLFAITQNRKYWRLREPHMDSCPGATDYIDIYF